VKSLLVVDVRAFPSATLKNPTPAILALAWHVTDHRMGELKACNL
jgi:hypothetical protein